MKPLATFATVAFLVAYPGLSPAQTCGSALFAERTTPAVFQGITLGTGTYARMWALGQGSQSYSDNACLTGCKSLSASPLCQGGGNCLAVTGVNWLNATCQTAGTRPATTVFLVESTTTSDGGRWAAFKLPSNGTNANYDLDTVGAAACGPSCASVASPLIGDANQPIQVTSATLVGTTLTLGLAWTAPNPAAQALNSGGVSLVTTYSIYVARSSGGTPPAMTGGKSGWTRVADTDTTQVAGYSTNAAATVAINTGGSGEGVYVAIGLNFDGTGNPGSDANTKVSDVISHGTLVYRPNSNVPVVTAVTPSAGSTAGGMKVIIRGSALTQPTAATIGGAPLGSLEGIDASTVLGTTPAGAAGPASVTVTTSGGTGTLTAGFTFLDLPPAALEADTHGGSGGSGNNGVLEPGEQAMIIPTWENRQASSVSVTGNALGFIGPPGATYSIVDAGADYGNIAAGTTANCYSATGNCYVVSVSNPPTRPALHWDAVLAETLSTGQTKTWAVHVGNSFADVPPSYWVYKYIETVLHSGITAGCDAADYCPGILVNRWQMAVFVAKAMTGGPVPVAGTVPGLGPYNCVSGGQSVFLDVPPTDGGCPFIHYVAAKEITAGCGGGNYCPTAIITRWQVAVFLAKALDGNNVPVSGTVPGLGSYNCVSGGQSVFLDVPPTDGGCKFIHYIAAQGITAGCGGGNYCPNTQLARDQMAVFMTKAFHLNLYGR